MNSNVSSLSFPLHALMKEADCGLLFHTWCAENNFRTGLVNTTLQEWQVASPLHHFALQTTVARFPQVITFSRLLSFWQLSLPIRIIGLNQHLTISPSSDNCLSIWWQKRFVPCNRSPVLIHSTLQFRDQ